MYNPKTMLEKDLYTYYHAEGKRIISINDVWSSFKIKGLQLELFVVQYVLPNFPILELIPIDLDNDMYGMEKENIERLVEIVEQDNTMAEKMERKIEICKVYK